jgi:hypothetical protein
MTSIKKIGKHIKKANKKIKKSPVTKTAGDVGLEVAESTPPGELAAAIVAENEQENSKK